MFQELLELPGWARLVEAARAQVHNRRIGYVRGPIKEGSNVYEQQWMLGEANGIETFISLPRTLIESSRAIIEEHQQTVATEEPNVPEDAPSV